MQISFVTHIFQLILLVSYCSGRPGRNIKSTGGRGSSATFKSGYYGQDNKNHDAEPDYAPNHRDNEAENTYEYDDKGAGVYEKLDQIVYPFQQYIQVRHSYSVEHLPIKESDDNVEDNPGDNASHQHTASASSNFDPVKESPLKKHSLKKRHPNRKPKSNINLDTSASSRNENQDYDDSENQEQDEDEERDYESQSSYKDVKPRLKEEIEDYKKQEVYEEKGYADGAYDHENYGVREDHTYHDKGRDENQEYSDDDNNGKYRAEDQPSSSSTPKKSRSKPKNPPRPSSPHLSELPTSTKLLEYAASNLYDKEAHEKGIYAARENIYCPEVTDFNLSSKKMAMGKGGKNPRGSKPRLTGLGAKIKCLKEKYFGVEPLPRQIFMDPAESRVTPIQIPTFDQFYKSFRTEVDSISDFQHF